VNSIERYPHTDGEESWNALCMWIEESIRMPDGEKCPEHIVKVLAVGALIGARFGLLSPAFALGLAEYSNSQKGTLWESIQIGFANSYLEWVVAQVESVYHNLGFTHVTHQALVRHVDAPEGTPPITDEDQTSIMTGLDELFGKGKGFSDA